MLHGGRQSIDTDFLQASQQLVQGLSKGGQGLPDVQMSLSPIKRSTIHTSRTLGNTCSREKHFSIRLQSRGTHPPPPAWGFSIKLLSISFLCCVNLGLVANFTCCTCCLVAFVQVACCFNLAWHDVKLKNGKPLPVVLQHFLLLPQSQLFLAGRKLVYRKILLCV